MAGSKNPRVEYRCSFCGKSQEQVHRLIAGPGGVYICNECIDLCNEIIHEEAGQVLPQQVAAVRGDEQLRSKAFSSAHEVRRSIAARDYEKAVTEAESLLEQVRELTKP